MGTHNFGRRLNLEGVLAFGTNANASSYIQLYRNGVIEAVNGEILALDYEGEPTIPSVIYEKYIFEYLPTCFRVQKDIGANVPIVVALTLTKTKGLRMGAKTTFERSEAIDADTIILSEVIVQDFSTSPGKILKPLFDLVWNACGCPFSLNFDADGNWIERQ